MSQRKIWTEKEDQILKKLRGESQIIKWSKISEIMCKEYNIKQRTGKQCRQRYQNHLRQGIDKSPWSFEEEALLIKLHLQYGNKWVNISDQIKQQGNFRTGNNAKNYFMSLLKKSVRNYNRLLSSYKKSGLRPVQLSFISKMLNIFMEQLYDQSKKDTSKLELCKKIQSSLLYFRRVEEQKVNEEDHQEKIYETYNFIKEFKKCTNKRRKRFRCQSEIPIDEEGIKIEYNSTKWEKQQKQVQEQNFKNSPVLKNQIFQSQSSQLSVPQQPLAEIDSKKFIKKNTNDQSSIFKEEKLYIKSLQNLREDFLDISEFFGTINHFSQQL